MKPVIGNLGESLRIIWAVTSKDIIDGLKNRTTLSVILTTLILIVFYRFLPALENGDVLPRLVIYDAGDSRLVAEAKNSTAFDLLVMPSQEDMEAYVGNKDIVVLGLALPEDLDQKLENGKQIDLEGYVVHWASSSAAAEVRVFFEQQLTELSGRPVHINTAGNTVYTQKESHGYAFLAALAVVITMLIIGVNLVLTMMVEEKQTRTIDALLVSPAGIGQIVIGKALTGLFYCLMATGLVLAFNAPLITHWGLAILASICGSLFTVGLGLLMGNLIEANQSMPIWVWVLFIIFLMPVLLSSADFLPAGVLAALSWVPTVALSKVVRVSFSNSAPLAQFGPELANVVACAVLLLAVTVWALRRTNR